MPSKKKQEPAIPRNKFDHRFHRCFFFQWMLWRNRPRNMGQVVQQRLSSKSIQMWDRVSVLLGVIIKLLAARNTCKKHHLAPLTFQGAKLVERIRVPTGPKGFELLGIVWKLHAREVTC